MTDQRYPTEAHMPCDVTFEIHGDYLRIDLVNPATHESLSAMLDPNQVDNLATLLSGGRIIGD